MSRQLRAPRLSDSGSLGVQAAWEGVASMDPRAVRNTMGALGLVASQLKFMLIPVLARQHNCISNKKKVFLAMLWRCTIQVYRCKSVVPVHGACGELMYVVG